MKDNADFDLGLDGYADQRGTSAYNKRLSDRRVKAVADALAAVGVPAARMKSGAFGEERALCSETTEDCYQRNRRVEVFVRPRGK